MAEILASKAPVVLQTVGDVFSPPCRIMAIVWTGTTTSGDTVQLRDKLTGELLWEAFTDTTKTYLGINLSDLNVHTNGFRAAAISAGKVIVYLAQN